MGFLLYGTVAEWLGRGLQNECRCTQVVKGAVCKTAIRWFESSHRLKTANYLVVCSLYNPIMLEFDHLKREDKKYEISKMMSDYKWGQILLEISKCEVVCANHHKLRIANQFGWYKNNIN